MCDHVFANRNRATGQVLLKIGLEMKQRPVRVILSCRLAYDTYLRQAPSWPSQPSMIPASYCPAENPRAVYEPCRTIRNGA
jgi:hypothetical protein